MNHPEAIDADFALLLEGTFPYVSGGVSGWIDQIIRAFPEYRFAIIFLGSRKSDYTSFKYELPPNVVHFEEHYLYDQLETKSLPVARKGGREGHAMIDAMLRSFRTGDRSVEGMSTLSEISAQMQPGGNFSQDDFLYGERAWNVICQEYREYCTDPSFVDYFWTVRIMYQPLWMLARVAQRLLQVRAIHCASTGYAGYLGALVHELRGIPLILSEHGIYTKERKIDLFKSEWIRDNRNVFQRDPTELSYFRQMWIQFFEHLGYFCYTAADPIIALYEANRVRQVADGANPARTLNIPNGISLARFAPLREQRTEEAPIVLCLIGRVVPIKDVKTFIRAMRRVANQMPQAQGWIAGPTDEDPAYAQECKDLVLSLGLEQNVRFLGFQRVEDLLPNIGIVVLSSISEALPLVILEGYAAGVPVVCTDVGSCRQLVEGLDDEDKALGVSGSVVPIADPQRLADASLALLTDARAWRAASKAGMARVERYYTDTVMFSRYGKVFENALLKTAGAF